MLSAKQTHFSRSYSTLYWKENINNNRVRKHKKHQGLFPLFEAEESAGMASKANTKCSTGWLKIVGPSQGGDQLIEDWLHYRGSWKISKHIEDNGSQGFQHRKRKLWKCGTKNKPCCLGLELQIPVWTYF